MAKGKSKPAAAASSSSSSSTVASPVTPKVSKPLGPLDFPSSPVLVPEDEVIKVNNANLNDLKNALDDVVKKYLSHASLFTPNHIHTDTKLLLGYLAVLTALVTALYSYKTPFEESKHLTAVGVSLYFLLTTLTTIYVYAVEKETIFMGKRRNITDGRIETDRLRIDTRTKVAEKGWASVLGRFLWALSPQSRTTSSVGPGAAAKGGEQEPQYVLTYTYKLTASSGRSLVAKRTETREVPYSKFFDVNGVLLSTTFQAWLGEAIQAAVTGEPTPSST